MPTSNTHFRAALAALAIHAPSLAAVCLAGLVAGGGCAPQNEEKLIVTGSSTVAPLAAEIGKRFEERNPGVRISVQTGGSSRGVADARSGQAHIGMVSRATKDSESDLHAFPLALDGICIIVHKDNPVVELTPDQIRGIYRGETANWSEAGGADASITVVSKAAGRSTLELFLAHFNLGPSEIDADVVIGDNAQGIKTVAGDPQAVGYVSIGAAEVEAQRGATIRLLPLGGVEASLANLKSGEFPLSRTLHFVTREPPEGWAKKYLDFARSSEVHDLVEGLSFVPLER